jgi:hypothetical protein
MVRGNPKKLVPNSARSPQELKEQTRKGGIASGEARRRRKTMREWAKAFAEMGVNTKGLNGEEITADYAGAVVLGQFRKAVKEGDTSSAKFIAELLGEMVQKVEHSGTGVVVQVTDKVLAQEIAQAIDNKK